jgi:cob(I)alamin adenosyltransferase
VKAYTGKGDQGKTSLYSGERVAKNHPRVEACGDIDELNSVMGALISLLPADKSDLKVECEHVQSVLFVAGAWLSTTADSAGFARVGSVEKADTELLERFIERMDAQLPPLKEFILPGGHFCAGLAHMARTVCRRAERHVVILEEEFSKEEAQVRLIDLVRFLNRLSSYLFVLARYINRVYGEREALWKNPRSESNLPK